MFAGRHGWSTLTDRNFIGFSGRHDDAVICILSGFTQVPLCYVTRKLFFFRGEGVGKRRNAEQQAMEIVGVFQTGSDEVNRTWQLVGVFQSLKSSPSFPLGRRMEGKRIQRQAK